MAEGGTVSTGGPEEPTSHAAVRSADTTANGRTAAPTLHQWRLGTLMRSLRAERGMTVEQVAETLLCSPTRVRRLEAAAVRPSARELLDLRALFKLDDATADELLDLARKAEQRGWWAKYDDLGLPYIGLEAHASSITAYTMSYLPGLLQTKEYARAIITGIALGIEPKILQQRVEARLRRQDVLETKNPVQYRALLDEAVLHRPIGGRNVMYEQLDKVLIMARTGKVTVQMVPFDRGAYSAQDSNFVLLQFDEPKLSPIVYVEGLAADHFLERKEDVDRYRETVESLRQSALSPHESLRRIKQAQETYKNS